MEALFKSDGKVGRLGYLLGLIFTWALTGFLVFLLRNKISEGFGTDAYLLIKAGSEALFIALMWPLTMRRLRSLQLPSSLYLILVLGSIISLPNVVLFLPELTESKAVLSLFQLISIGISFASLSLLLVLIFKREKAVIDVAP